MNKFNISIIHSFEQWQELASEWNDLLTRSMSDTVFLTWEWLFSWAECCLKGNRDLFILTIYEKEKLVGIAPWYIQKKRVGFFCLNEISFLGTPETGSDYLDVIAIKGKEKEVAHQIYDFLMGKGADFWDILRLQDIPADALFLLHFKNIIQANGKYCELLSSSFCPIANLPPTVDEYFADLSSKRRKRFNQQTNILNRHGTVSHDVFRKDIPDHVFDNFFKLYEEKGGWSSKHVRPILENFQKLQNGSVNVQVDLMSVDGQLVAGLFFLKYKKTLFLYLVATDKSFLPKASVGNVLIGNSLKNAIDSGITTYDFLKGEEGYKFHWATGGKSSIQLFFWQKRPAAVASALARLARYAGKLLVR